MDQGYEVVSHQKISHQKQQLFTQHKRKKEKLTYNKQKTCHFLSSYGSGISHRIITAFVWLLMEVDEEISS